MRATAIRVALGLVGLALPALTGPATADTEPAPDVAATAIATEVSKGKAYKEYHCDRPLVICYDRDGELFGFQEKPYVPSTPEDIKITRDEPPPDVRPGDGVTVIVLTQAADKDKDIISVTFQGRKSQEIAFEGPSKSGDSAGSADARTGSAPEPFIGLPFSSEPVPDDVLDFEITFRRKATPDKDVIKLQQQRMIPVYHGYSFYSVALIVAATFKGDRHVLRDLDTTADHAVDPGLALNIFPFGRERGRIGYLLTCKAGRIGRCLADMVGFQLATDLDLRDPTDKLYIGLVFEPVAGLGLAGGVSLRKVAVVPSPGALPATEVMTGAAPTDTRYVVRGYIAVTMTFDLLDTISSMGTKIRGVKYPQ